MSSFLQLCASLVLRSGVFGAAPSTVVGQSGRSGQCVDWIATAWKLIQGSSPDWSFLKGEWSGSLVIGTASYAAANLGIATRFSKWTGDRQTDLGLYQPVTIYDPALGRSNENALRQISYEAWRTAYDRGVQVNNRPLYYCLAPDLSIRFGPIPDKAYSVRGEYRKSPQVLAADNDVPDFPVEYHDIIVWRAMVLVDEDDEAPVPVGMQRARERYSQMLADMQRECLPQVTTRGDGPLA